MSTQQSAATKADTAATDLGAEWIDPAELKADDVDPWTDANQQAERSQASDKPKDVRQTSARFRQAPKERKQVTSLAPLPIPLRESPTMPRNAHKPRGEAFGPSGDESTAVAVLDDPRRSATQPEGRPAHWFKPGQSGNPLGAAINPRPVTAKLKQVWDQKELLGKEIPGGFTCGDLVIAGLIKGAAKGDARCLALIFDRLDGKQTRETRLTVDVGRLSDAELMERASQVFLETTATEGE